MRLWKFMDAKATDEKKKKHTQSNTGKHNIIVDICCHCNENIAHVRSLSHTSTYTHARTHAQETLSYAIFDYH